MGRYKYLLLFIILFFSASKVGAAACSNASKVEYQERAKNISYTYKYNDETNVFEVTFTNVTEGLYLRDLNGLHNYKPTNNEITLTNVEPGYSYRFGIYTSDKNPCSHSNLYPLYVTLPFYNPYYHDSLCDGIKEYKYCKKFVNKNITYEEFKTSVEEYREKFIEQQEEKEDTISSVALTLLVDTIKQIISDSINIFFVLLTITPPKKMHFSYHIF